MCDCINYCHLLSLIVLTVNTLNAFMETDQCGLLYSQQVIFLVGVKNHFFLLSNVPKNTFEFEMNAFV